ncbi:MAG: TOBE domain-containing protein, partial [Actinomycetota bacterium]|nr:TOBE domain-containing protein [Actinomycetota bacterium]
SNVLDGDVAEALVGRTGTFAVRPERIAVLMAGGGAAAGSRTVDATVAEVIYAGPTTRVAAVAQVAGPPGVTLTATVLNAAASLPDDVGHGTRITLAWPDSAVHDLTN